MENLINDIILKERVMLLNAKKSRELIESNDEDTSCVLYYARRVAEGPKGSLNGILKI